eukprot:SAG22_NODE_330_length_12211_cov_6.451948_6_plen_129_part_00
MDIDSLDAVAKYGMLRSRILMKTGWHDGFAAPSDEEEDGDEACGGVGRRRRLDDDVDSVPDIQSEEAVDEDGDRDDDDDPETDNIEEVARDGDGGVGGEEHGGEGGQEGAPPRERGRGGKGRAEDGGR